MCFTRRHVLLLHLRDRARRRLLLISQMYFQKAATLIDCLYAREKTTSAALQHEWSLKTHARTHTLTCKTKLPGFATGCGNPHYYSPFFSYAKNDVTRYHIKTGRRFGNASDARAATAIWWPLGTGRYRGWRASL